MKKNYVLIGVTLVAITALSFRSTSELNIGNFNKKEFMASHLSTSSGPNGRTGAPGESNCTACHSGTVQDGSAENTFLVLAGANQITDYTPGATYTISLAMNSNPAKRGFSATALDASNNMAGDFAAQALAGTQVSTQTGREYATPTAASTLATNNAFWAWSWTAPATNVGPVTFYVATNATNNNGQSTGDIIYLSEHVIGSTAGIDDNKVSSSLVIGYNTEDHKVLVDLNSSNHGNVFLNLVDLNGRSVFTSELGYKGEASLATSVKLPTDMRNGLYVANVFVNNRSVSQKVMVQR
jgi:hypothetical protein